MTGRLNLGKLNSAKNEERKEPTAEELDELSDRHGFVSRDEPVRKKSRRRKVDEPQTAMTIRLPIVDYNDFVEFCDDFGNSTFAEGLVELMKRAGASSRR